MSRFPLRDGSDRHFMQRISLSASLSEFRQCVLIVVSSDMQASCVETLSLLHMPLRQAVSSSVFTAVVSKTGIIYVKINTNVWVLSVCVTANSVFLQPNILGVGSVAVIRWITFMT